MNSEFLILVILLSGCILCNLLYLVRRNRRISSSPPSDSTLSPETECEFKRLDAALDIWVARKCYCESGKSRFETASELGTSKEVLHRYFLVRKGLDFNSWRTMMRVEEAKRLLLQDIESPIHMIGEACGFSDRSNFHRQFERITGCSPKQWRDSGGRPEVR